MKEKNNLRLNYQSSEFLEFHFPLREWVKGTELITEITTSISQRAKKFSQLLQWKQQGYLWPKPTLSTAEVFTFWVNTALHEAIHQLPGLFGGHPINNPYISSGKYQRLKTTTREKKTPRPRLILLDSFLDTPELTDKLSKYNLTFKRIWDDIADLIQYELIDVCKINYVDLIVTTNDRLFTSSEEWLQYLLPNRTRLCIVSKDLLDDPERLASMINQRAWMKKSRSKKTEEKKPLLITKNMEGIQ